MPNKILVIGTITPVQLQQICSQFVRRGLSVEIIRPTQEPKEFLNAIIGTYLDREWDAIGEAIDSGVDTWDGAKDRYRAISKVLGCDASDVIGVIWSNGAYDMADLVRYYAGESFTQLSSDVDYLPNSRFGAVVHEDWIECL